MEQALNMILRAAKVAEVSLLRIYFQWVGARKALKWMLGKTKQNRLLGGTLRPASIIGSLTTMSGLLLTIGLQAQTEIGDEIEQLRRDTEAPPASTPAPSKPDLDNLQLELPPLDAVPEDTTPASGSPIDPPAAASETLQIKQLTWTGDREFLDRLGLQKSVEQALRTPPTETELQKLIDAHNRQFIEKGYYLARIYLIGFDPETGTLELQVDRGKIGNINFFELDTPYDDTTVAQRNANRQPYEGYFSEEQIRLKLGGATKGDTFDYNRLHSDLFTVNAIPDLVLHTDLRTRREVRDEIYSERFVDLDFYVEDEPPMHAVLELKNTGTEKTDDFRLALKMQHLNLTQNYDALTVAIPVSLDFETTRAISGSYIRPLDIGKGAGISLFGGYSELQVDEVIEGIDVAGDGIFFGPRYFQHLVKNDNHVINAVAGLFYRQINDEITQEDSTIEDTTIDVLPLSLGLTYSSVQPDALNGRTFASGLLSYNIGDGIGLTDAEDIDIQRAGADPDYWMAQAGVSRIWSMFGKPDPDSGERVGDWYLYNNIDVQWTEDALIPGDQKTLGGFETVRGYSERVAAADRGGYFRNEFRTPIYRGFLTRLLNRKATFAERQKRPADYLQLVAFFDAGYIENTLDQPDVPDSYTMASVGGGIRLAFGQFSQIKVDYGYPLKDIEDESDNGRVHIAVEVQY